MSSELLDIQPPELRFTFEVKKQSLCSIQLINKLDQHVAFKVKTTSPKKYCVRPNIGIIMPNGTSDFTVVMQAQDLAPPDLLCKDKFLVQSTIIPSGTTEGDLTSDMFAKDSAKYVEERKLRVILLSKTESPAPSLVNGVLKRDISNNASVHKDITPAGIEILPPTHKDVEEIQNAKAAVNSLFPKLADAKLAEDPDELKMAKNMESREAGHVEIVSPDDEITLKLKEDIDELKSKIDVLGSKLAEAEQTVAKLTEERSSALQEKALVERELAMAKRRSRSKTVYVGFPVFYVCMVALINLTLGYMMHS